MKKKLLIAGIITLAAAVLIAAAVFIVNYVFGGNPQPQKPAEATTAATEATTATDDKGNVIVPETEPLADDPTELLSYMAVNDELYSWIVAPDTQINNPVAQAKMQDNFYIDHDVNKDYSFAGTIYTQLCNSKDYSDRVTVLYGHNMLNGSMFADLHKYRDETFFNDHPYFYIYTKDSKLTYQVVSAFDYDDRHIINSFDFRDDKVFTEWLDELQHPHTLSANVRDGVKLDTNSKIVVLSTCQNNDEGRYLVTGVLIKTEKTH